MPDEVKDLLKKLTKIEKKATKASESVLKDIKKQHGKFEQLLTAEFTKIEQS